MIYGTRIFAFDKYNNDATVTEANNIEETLNMNQEISYELELAMGDEEFAERLDNLYESQLDKYFNEIIVSEGANTEYTETFKKHFTDYKDAFKAGKSYKKAGKLSDAKKSFQKAAKVADDLLKDIKAVTSDNLGSAICGFFISALISSLVLVVSSIGPLAIVGYPAITIKSIHELINMFKALVKDKDKLAKGLNSYKNQLETAGKFLKQIAELAAKKCDSEKKLKESYENANSIEELIECNVESEDEFNDYMVESVLIMEGATSEYIEIAKKQKNIYKTEMKAGKDAFKAGKSSEAKKHYLNAVSACDELEKNFKKVTSDDIGSVLSGFGLNLLYGIGAKVIINCLSLLLAMVPVVGGILPTALVIAKYAGKIRSLIHFFKTFDSSDMAKSFNLYRNNVEAGFELMKTIAKNSASKC